MKLCRGAPLVRGKFLVSKQEVCTGRRRGGEEHRVGATLRAPYADLLSVSPPPCAIFPCDRAEAPGFTRSGGRGSKQGSKKFAQGDGEAGRSIGSARRSGHPMLTFSLSHRLPVQFFLAIVPKRPAHAAGFSRLASGTANCGSVSHGNM